MKRKGLLKQAIAILLATAMVAATGCGSSGSSSSSSSTPADSSSSTTESAAPADDGGVEAAADLKGDEVDLRVMVWDRGDAAPGTTTEDNSLTKWIQEQVKELFNINVTYVSVPRSESDDKVNIMMSGGTAPDIVFTYDQNLFYNYASSGALTDLTDIYAQYGGSIAEYCAEAQEGIADLDGRKYAVMKQRGTDNARHMAYIRQDWLDQLNMEMPTTKEELGEYLYAVKDAGLGIPWVMSGRGDTEKGYISFVGSYVDLPTERDEYIYASPAGAYLAIAPGSKDGIKQLNTWYNDGLITQDFPTDTDETIMLADIANGNAGFTLTDLTQTHAQIEVLNNTLGKKPTFVPVNPFELSDGSYRTLHEFRYAMFVMVPTTAGEEKAIAAMKYLNWMADPEVAMKIRYTPELEFNERGSVAEMSQEERYALGYPGTCDDLCIMNLNFPWVNDYDILAADGVANQATDWSTEEWWRSIYETADIGKLTPPSYAFVPEAETTYGVDVASKLIQFVYTCICAPADQFESTYESGYQELVNAGLQKILDGRAEYYDSTH